MVAEDPYVSGALLRSQRVAAGLTQRQLASRAHVSLGMVRDLEQGLTRRPRSESLARLAIALGLTAAEPASLSAPLCAGPQDQPARIRHLLVRSSSAQASKTGVRVQVLGPLRAWRDGTPLPLGPPLQQSVLALLAAATGAPLRRETIAQALWPTGQPCSATAAIHTYISRLRKVLDPRQAGMLPRTAVGYHLRTDAAHVDAAVFTDLAAQARAALRAGDPRTSADLYDRALAMWQGEPADGLDAPNAHPILTALAWQGTQAVMDYADLAASQGWYNRVIPHLRALADREPLNERAGAALMIALAACGYQATALATYQRLSQALDEQLGLMPGPELRDAHLRVLRNATHPIAQLRPASPDGLASEIPRQEPGPVIADGISRNPRRPSRTKNETASQRATRARR